LLFPLGGCYYGHLARGQIERLWQRTPLEEAQRDPDLSAETRALLALVPRVRNSASALGLEVGGQYTTWVDWPGDRIVTTLARTHVGSLEAAPWWFPILGRLPYKGYFDRGRAEAEAERIRRAGRYDVCVSRVTAYSTLGWMNDPVTRPMLSRGAASFVETLFHELVHATAFRPGEADFNEGAAQFIGQQAALRFFAEPPLEAESVWPEAERVAQAIEDRQQVSLRLLAFKQKVETLDGEPDRALRRAVAERETRAELARLPLRVLDARRVAERAQLSDACLSLRGAYIADMQRHAAVLTALDGDLAAMVERLREWSDPDRPIEGFFAISGATSASVADQLDHTFLHETAEDL
jgi:predicted aminopeptidase